ncbi:MAG: cytochrome d ubiquinol oxidase subunit II [Eggerthellaceae bacterium]|nr:cytochrome d ubiquinol oxidase subunit II [Eggerthellaceae bacterium]
MTGLGILWFILIAVLIIGYFALDGFDLGVGVLYPFLGKDEKTKRILRTSVGPIWDGNEVWLLTAGGALFAAFAPAYATSFSGFYLAIMLVLFGLIIRAVSVEYRSHEPGHEKLWDVCFFIGSFLPALLFGVAIGNVIEGLPLNAHGDYTGTFLALLNPFALVCGVLGLVHMLTQGAAWISLKAPLVSGLRAKASRLRRLFAAVDLVVFVVAAIIFFVAVLPNSGGTLSVNVLAVIFAALFIIGDVGVIACGMDDPKRDVLGIVSAGIGCVGLVGMTFASMFPNIIPALNPAYSITIANAASSDTALFAMTIIACIGVPLVLIYHIIVYRAFRGRIDE